MKWLILIVLLLSGCTAEPPPPVLSTWSPPSMRQAPPPVPLMTTGLYPSSVLKTGDGYVLLTKDQAIGVDGAGVERWNTGTTEETKAELASGLLVLRTDEDLRAIDPVTGKQRWAAKGLSESALFQKTAYTSVCASEDRCVLAARDTRTGRKRWTARMKGDDVPETDTVGARWPDAPPDAEYLVVVTSSTVMASWRPAHGSYRVRAVILDAATGKPTGASVQWEAWHGLVAGRTLVITNSDEPECGSTLWGYDARTGARKWRKVVGSQRERDGSGECLGGLSGGSLDLLGGGDHVLTHTSGHQPQVLDLVSGRTLWKGRDPGAVVAGDSEVALVREWDNEGGLTLYDLTSGKPLWTARDPGGSEVNANIHGDRVVIAENFQFDCYGEERGCQVRVHDRATGRLVLTPPGSYVGSGDGWVAVSVEAQRLSVYSTR